MDCIIRVENLVKSYGDVLAVDDISFSVKRGSLFAFLGVNGAGKSTTINIMTTLLGADSGKVYINEHTDDVYIRNKIGVVFQENMLDDFLTVKENLIYRGSLYQNNKEDVKNRYEELREFLHIDGFENKRFGVLSGGQKRRVEIARALFGNPEILLLDEPTTGLDPETRRVVWNVINDLKKRDGLTIFLTTHYMEEAANADHVVIINKGKIIAEGTPSELKEKYSYDCIKIVPINKTKLIESLDSENRNFEKISNQFIIPVSDPKDSIYLINKLKDNIKQYEVLMGSMDDVFINVVGGEECV